MEPSRCNRCGAWVYDGTPLCPNCALRYKEVYNNTPKIVIKSEVKKRIPISIKVIYGFSTIILLLLSIYIFGNGRIFNRIEYASFPPHAQVFEFDEALFQTLKSSLILETGDDYAYFVKIINQENENIILSVFLYPNESYETEIPLGDYRIEYYFGKRWESILSYFGNDTQSKRIEEIITFVQNNVYHVELE